MLRHTLLGLTAAVFATVIANAQTAPPPVGGPIAAPAAPAPKPNPKVKLETAQGIIVVELFLSKAPITVANYLKYVDRGLFNGATFYRASRPPGYAADDYGLIQGGLQNDPKKVLPPIAHESTIRTGLTHRSEGTISMGRHAPGSAQADWSITLGDMSYLDADTKDSKNPGFAAFGQVVEGLDVVKKIIVLPTDPNRGEGAMKGEMLKQPIRILKASRVPIASPAPILPVVVTPDPARSPL